MIFYRFCVQFDQFWILIEGNEVAFAQYSYIYIIER